MSKNKKKRNKSYSGENAALTKPVVTRVSASDRSRIRQWIFDHQKQLKVVRTVALVILGLAIIISGIVEIF